MLAAEHRRPLGAFALVLAAACLIMGNGLRTQVVEILVRTGGSDGLISALAPDMVLGQSLRGVPAQTPAPQATSEAPASAQGPVEPPSPGGVAAAPPVITLEQPSTQTAPADTSSVDRRGANRSGSARPGAARDSSPSPRTPSGRPVVSRPDPTPAPGAPGQPVAPGQPAAPDQPRPGFLPRPGAGEVPSTPQPGKGLGRVHDQGQDDDGRPGEGWGRDSEKGPDKWRGRTGRGDRNRWDSQGRGQRDRDTVPQVTHQSRTARVQPRAVQPQQHTYRAPEHKQTYRAPERKHTYRAPEHSWSRDRQQRSEHRSRVEPRRERHTSSKPVSSRASASSRPQKSSGEQGRSRSWGRDDRGTTGGGHSGRGGRGRSGGHGR